MPGDLIAIINRSMEWKKDSFCSKMGYFSKKISALLLAYIALSVGIITIYQDYFEERFG
jgi:hypothetical protein